MVTLGLPEEQLMSHAKIRNSSFFSLLWCLLEHWLAHEQTRQEQCIVQCNFHLPKWLSLTFHATHNLFQDVNKGFHEQHPLSKTLQLTLKEGFSSPIHWGLAAEKQQLCGEVVFSKGFRNQRIQHIFFIPTCWILNYFFPSFFKLGHLQPAFPLT